MRHLIIDALGPLKHVDIFLERLNVIIGPQSSGKSCVLKTASYCTWVEKRIQIAQSADSFVSGRSFLDGLVKYHKLQQYIRQDTRIEYESDAMHFIYDNQNAVFSFEWRSGRWNYQRSKVTYIPAERNMVAVIPNWFDVKLGQNNIRGFMSDWVASRNATTDNVQVLNLDAKYRFDSTSGRDVVTVDGGLELDLINTSSGLQSLIPLYIHLNFLSKQMYDTDITSMQNDSENDMLLNKIYEEFFEKVPKKNSIYIAKIGRIMKVFDKEEHAEQCKKMYARFTKADHSDIFLEEPEQNLFPPTQTILTDWLVDMTQGVHPSNLFIATHSPYILNTLVEYSDLQFNLFVTRMEEGYSMVKTATDADIQSILDFGVDAFLNTQTMG